MSQDTAPRPLKIGYLMQADAADMSEVSGPQVHVKAVIQGLRRRGHRVRLVAIQGGQTVWTDDLDAGQWQPARFTFSRSVGFRAVEKPLRVLQTQLKLPYLRLFDSLRFADACVQTLAGFDVLYERYGLLSYGGLLAARRFRIPLIFEVNGDVVDEYATLGITLSRSQWAINRWIARRMFRAAAAVVSPGERLAQVLVERWRADPAHVKVIFNGTEFDVLSKAYPAASVRSRFGLTTGPQIVYVGGFQRWQGVDVLLRAFAAVRQQMTEASLVLVGDGPERVQAVELASRLGVNDAVVFAGRLKLPDVAAVLSLADVAAAPYRDWTEMTGMKLLDYMAAGRPIVVSAHNGRHALLKHLETALLVEPGDEQQLAQSILLLLKDETLRLRLGRNAQAKAKAQHTWDHTAAEIEALCYNLVNRR